MLLYWHSHWTLLPLQTLDPGHRVPDELRGAILFLAHIPYPGMVEPNGLRGGSSRDEGGGASDSSPAAATEQPVTCLLYTSDAADDM
eukprot:8137994-Prorocentrum_lima.AAC.1